MDNQVQNQNNQAGINYGNNSVMNNGMMPRMNNGMMLAMNNGMIPGMNNGNNFGNTVGINNGNNPEMNNENIQNMQQPKQMSVSEKKKCEMEKNLHFQMGKIRKGQKELMDKIKRNEMIRQNQRMTRKITIFFKFFRSENYFDLLHIEFKANTKLKDVLEKYKHDSNKQNVRFMLDEQELSDNDERTLGEIEEINDGEEIRVKSSS